jgi:condensin complex subunit 1
MAELLNVLAKEFDHVQLTDEILREIAKMSFKAQENKESRVISKFLVKLAETIPRTVLRQMAVLQVHLDSEVGVPAAWLFWLLMPATVLPYANCDR